jgi:hypothetical protein
MQKWIVDSSYAQTINNRVLIGFLKSLGAKYVRENKNGFVIYQADDQTQHVIEKNLYYPALAWYR